MAEELSGVCAGSSDGAVPARRFRYDELKQATNKFKTKLIEDELGVLYLGTLPKDNRKIGVKVLSECSQFTEDQFHSKVRILLLHPTRFAGCQLFPAIVLRENL